MSAGLHGNSHPRFCFFRPVLQVFTRLWEQVQKAVLRTMFTPEQLLPRLP